MHAPTIPRQLLALGAFLLLTFVAAGVGAVASINAAGFYQQLVQPGWAPPAAVFGPVWSALYLLIGIAAWLVWKARGLHAARTALTLFAVQLAANALWTWLFFAWHRGSWAFAEIIVLWFLIFATIVAFWRIRPAAGVLLLPYLAWVSFACGLTWAMWRLNPGVLA